MNVEAPQRKVAEPNPLGLRIIGGIKLASAGLLLAAAFGLFRMVHSGLTDSLEHLALRLHLDPENHLVRELIDRAGLIKPRQLRLIEFGALFYAALGTAEGVGLILVKPWAEYLTVIATASLLPLEVWEVLHEATPLRLLVLVVNLVILAYVVVKLRQRRAAHAANA